MKKILSIVILSCFLLFNSTNANAAYCVIYEEMHSQLIKQGYEITKIFLDDNGTKYELYMHMPDGKWVLNYIKFVHLPSAGVDVRFSCLGAKGEFSISVRSKSY